MTDLNTTQTSVDTKIPFYKTKMFWIGVVGIVVLIIVVAVASTRPVTCTSPQVLKDGKCIVPAITCTSPQVLKDGKCIVPEIQCTGLEERLDGKCVLKCLGLDKRVDGKCVAPCTSFEVLKGGVCYGPLDLLKSDFGAPSFCVSTRKLIKSYNGPCVVVFTGDIATGGFTTIGFDSTGMIDYEVFKTLKGPVSVTKWYDQSGNYRDFTSSTPDPLPTLTFTVMSNGVRKPIITFDSGFMRTDSKTTCDVLGLNNPNHSVMSSIRSTSVHKNVQFIYSSNAIGVNEMHLNGEYGIRVLDDATINTAYADNGKLGDYSDGKWHSFVSGASKKGEEQFVTVRVDGSATVSKVSGPQIGGGGSFTIGRRASQPVASYYFKGDMSEIIIFPEKWVDSTPNSYDLYLDGLKKYNENGYSTKL